MVLGVELVLFPFLAEAVEKWGEPFPRFEVAVFVSAENRILSRSPVLREKGGAVVHSRCSVFSSYYDHNIFYVARTCAQGKR